MIRRAPSESTPRCGCRPPAPGPDSVGPVAEAAAEPRARRADPAWAWLAGNRSLGAARGAWVASERRPFAEQADPAHRLVWRGRPDPLDGGLAGFEAVSARVLEPLFAHLDDGVET